MELLYIIVSINLVAKSLHSQKVRSLVEIAVGNVDNKVKQSIRVVSWLSIRDTRRLPVDIVCQDRGL